MTRRYVIDASVAAQWYFPGEHTQQAEGLLAAARELLAPGLLYLEIATLAWTRVQRGEIDRESAELVLAKLRNVPFERKPVTELSPGALSLALETGLSVAECLYLSLAVEARCQLVTADRVLYEAVAAGRLAAYVLWIGDVAFPPPTAAQ